MKISKRNIKKKKLKEFKMKLINLEKKNNKYSIKFMVSKNLKKIRINSFYDKIN